MPTHAELSAQLLTDAADFFRTMATQNPAGRAALEEHADLYVRMAALILRDAGGQTNGIPHATMAGDLLKNAAAFFRDLGTKNPPLVEQMTENAAVFEQMAGLIGSNPLGILE